MASGDDSILLDLLKRSRFDEESLPTSTSTQQVEIEKKVMEAYKQFENMLVGHGLPILKRHLTKEYLLELLTSSTLHESQDCDRVFHCYWIIHSLSLLKKDLDESTKSQVIKFLNSCQNETGGYGGGPGHISHLGATFAAINILVIIGTKEAYKSINRETLIQFLYSLRVGDGSFYMHIWGEIDIRALHCAISVATLTNIFHEDLFSGSVAWINRCQTYEGGFAGTPRMEAHGGYTFCAISALFLLDCKQIFNKKALLRWIANRQMSFEGGFQARTNTLVDSSLSFWLSGAIAIININLFATQSITKYLPSDRWIFETDLLQEYILICCQDKDGGFMDKPGMRRNIYHTCNALSGLSMAQYQINGVNWNIGNDADALEYIHPAYNISFKKVIDVKNYFAYRI